VNPICVLEEVGQSCWTNWRSLRVVFIVSLFLLKIGDMQPILFVIGYVDAALLLFVLWIAYRFVRSLPSPR
jgi:hypothetical protein